MQIELFRTPKDFPEYLNVFGYMSSRLSNIQFM